MKKFIQTLKNIWSIEELRSKILVTLLLILVYRFGAHIVLPGIDPNKLNLSGANTLNAGGGSALDGRWALSVGGFLTLFVILGLGAILGLVVLERQTNEAGPLQADKVVVVPRSSVGEMADLLKAGDAACYAAKEAGRNRVHTWYESDRMILERSGDMQWATRLAQALDEERLVLFGQRLQPLREGPDGLHVEALGSVTAMVLDQTAAIGISGPVAAGIEGVECIGAGALPLVPVASPDHPLARMERIPPGAGRDHIQLVLTDRSRFTEGRDFSVMSPRTWRLADLGAKHSLLREGIGWGNMPLSLIEADLATGALVRLHMPDHPGGMYRFAGVWRRDLPPGPAASWLLQQFVKAGAADRDMPGLGEI